jgi:HlyD family secretion protein
MGFVLILALTVSALLRGESEGRLGGYRVAEVSPAEIHLSVKAMGEIFMRDQRSVYARATGTISEVKAEYGMELAEGSVLAFIEPREYRLRLEEAESRLLAAQSEVRGISVRLSEARIESQRALRLYNADLIPRQDVEQAATKVQELQAQKTASEARVAQAGSALQRAQRELDWCEIRSPIAGVLLSRFAEAGDHVAPGGARPLFVVSPSLERAEVRVEVTEADVGNVRVGQSAEFSVEAHPERSFSGEVVSVRPGGEKIQGVVYYEVRVAVPNDEQRLLPGMTADVEIWVDARQAALAAPIEALLFSPDDSITQLWHTDVDAMQRRGLTILWAVDDEQDIRPVGVKLGARDADRVELVEGWNGSSWKVVTGR